MAKGHVDGPSFSDHEQSDPDAPPIVTRAMLGVYREEELSPPQLEEAGTHSSPPSPNEPPSSEQMNPSPPEGAPTTENPSPQMEREDSTVDSTDGNGPKGKARQSTRKPQRRAPTSRASIRRIPDDDDDLM